MQKEFYTFKKITLKEISAELPELSVVYYKTMKMAVITDKCGNTLEAYGLDKKKSAVESFCFYKNSGGEFVLHDIVLNFQTRIISNESYSKLSYGKTKEEEENISMSEMMPYVIKDLSSIGLVLDTSCAFIISIYEKKEYEAKRLEAKVNRETIQREK